MSPETPASKLGARYPLYVRMGYALIVAFAFLGMLLGHRGQGMVIAITVSIVWACTRMVQEGLEAYRILLLAKQHDAETKKGPPPAKP